MCWNDFGFVNFGILELWSDLELFGIGWNELYVFCFSGNDLDFCGLMCFFVFFLFYVFYFLSE